MIFKNSSIKIIIKLTLFTWYFSQNQTKEGISMNFWFFSTFRIVNPKIQGFREIELYCMFQVFPECCAHLTVWMEPSYQYSIFPLLSHLFTIIFMYSMQYNLIITVRPLSTNQYDFNTSYVTYHMYHSWFTVYKWYIQNY